MNFEILILNWLKIPFELWKIRTIDVPSKSPPWYFALSIPYSINFDPKKKVIFLDGFSFIFFSDFLLIVELFEPNNEVVVFHLLR